MRVVQLAKRFGRNGTSLFVSPDEKIAACVSDRRLWLVRIDSGEVLRVVTCFDSITCVKYSSDSKRVLVGSEDAGVRLVRLDKRKVVVMKGHTDAVLAVDLSPSGKTLASASNDGSVRVWASNGREKLRLPEHASGATGVRFLARLALESIGPIQGVNDPQGARERRVYDRSGRLVSTERLSPLDPVPGAPTKSLTIDIQLGALPVAVARADELCLVATEDGKLHLFGPSEMAVKKARARAPTGPRLRLLSRFEGEVELAPSVPGATDATASGGEVFVQTGERVQWSTLDGQTIADEIGRKVLCTAARWRLAVSPTELVVFDLAARSSYRQPLGGPVHAVWDLLGDRALVRVGEGSRESPRTIVVVDLRSRTIVSTIALSPERDRGEIAADPSFGRIFCGEPKVLNVLSLDGDVIARFEHGESSTSQMTLSPDGQRLAFFARRSWSNQAVLLWSLSELRLLSKRSKNPGSSLSFLPDGRLVTFRQGDQHFTLVDESGHETATPRYSKKEVWSLDASPDGARWIASAQGERRLIDGSTMASLARLPGGARHAFGREALACSMGNKLGLFDLDGQKTAEALGVDFDRLQWLADDRAVLASSEKAPLGLYDAQARLVDTVAPTFDDFRESMDGRHFVATGEGVGAIYRVEND
jgi:WD40 repeat protein